MQKISRLEVLVREDGFAPRPAQLAGLMQPTFQGARLSNHGLHTSTCAHASNYCTWKNSTDSKIFGSAVAHLASIPHACRNAACKAMQKQNLTYIKICLGSKQNDPQSTGP